MESLLAVLSTLGSIGTLFGGLVAWVSLSGNQRAELRRILKSLWEHSTKIVPVVLAAITSGYFVWNIYLFGSADGAPTRGEILLLLVSIWNAACYFLVGLVLFMIWLSELSKKDFPLQAQT